MGAPAGVDVEALKSEVEQLKADKVHRSDFADIVMRLGGY
jgi:hypothetical protein